VSESGRNARGATAAFWLLVLAAAAQRAWNAWSLPPLIGYDAPGHAGYILTILDEGRLPHPMEGWSTFHPPLYYLVGAAVWSLLDPLGPRAVVAGLRGIGALAGLAAGVVAYNLTRRFGASAATAWVATALVLFVPCIQMAAGMEGNEAFAAGLTALVLPPLLRLQADPNDGRAAGLTGLLAGVCLAAKFSGVSVAVAAFVPFLRRGLDRRALPSLAVCAAAMALVAGPVYVRNTVLTGSPVPMTRQRNPMRSAENAFVLHPRQVTDYLRVNPDCLLRPSIFHVAGIPGNFANRNRALTSVWGLAYDSIWYDAFANRVPLELHRDGIIMGPLLTSLGLVPTLVMLLGFVVALVDVVRSRNRSADAPLVAIWLLGLAMFVGFTWQAPSMVAVKGSYLLPLAVPGAIFFARGVTCLGPRLRVPVLVLSVAAAGAAASVFTNGLVFWTPGLGQGRLLWESWARMLPASHIAEAMHRLLGS
jgi:hypothetical protein